MATHQFDQATNQMVALPKGQRCEVPMSFLILNEGKVIFDGDAYAARHFARRVYSRIYFVAGQLSAVSPQ